MQMCSFKVRDVQVAFGFFSQCFAQRLSFLLHCFPPFQLLELVRCFLFHHDGNFWEVFRFSSGSLKCLETILVCQ